VAKRRRTTLLALWAAAVCALLTMSAVRPTGPPAVVRAWVFGYMAFPITAALILARRPGNNVGRTLALAGLGGASTLTLAWLAWTFPDAAWAPHLEALSNVTGTVMLAAILLLLHLFPTGWPVSRGWGRVLVATLGFVGLSAAVRLVALPLELGRANPFALDVPWPETTIAVLEQAEPILILLGLATLFVRYRRAGPVVRAQLRWFMAGTVVVLVFAVAYIFLPESAFPGVLAALLAAAGLWSLPLAILVAVTRYQLYEIDRILSRTVTYSVVLALLAAVYGGSVLALQGLLNARSDLAVAAATLAAAALFTPIRQRVRTALDRRFHRSHADAQRVVRSYLRQLKQTEQLDLDVLVDDLALAARRSMHPTVVGVHLQPPARTA
jgi:hypothetical protein